MVSARSEPQASPAAANCSISVTANLVTAYDIVATVKDPELPVITIADLGVLRDVFTQDGRVTVTITPTYSGCPAMDAIRSDIRGALLRAGYTDIEVVTKLSPAWSTDMISEVGREALARNGIAPPSRVASGPVAVQIGSREAVGVMARAAAAQMPACPRCGSRDVSEISRYASTACQSLWKCNDCMEPFNAVKPL